MSASVTNEELFLRCYGCVGGVNARLKQIETAIDQGSCITSEELLPSITKVRNDLRAALCAAQELKNRAKKMKRQSRKPAKA